MIDCDMKRIVVKSVRKAPSSAEVDRQVQSSEIVKRAQSSELVDKFSQVVIQKLGISPIFYQLLFVENFTLSLCSGLLQ